MDSNELPAAAYHPSHEKFEPPEAAGKQNPPKTVSSIEHLIRVALALGGTENALALTEKAIKYQKGLEEDEVFDIDFLVDRSQIENSNDPWLRQKLHELADEKQKILNQEKKLYERRVNWYENNIVEPLQDKIQRATGMVKTHGDAIEFTRRTVIDDSTSSSVIDSVDDNHTIHIDALSGVPITEFGYEPPINLTVAISPHSGSRYPFVPWCGTTVCTGPSKQKQPYITLCKHEVAALIKFADDDFNPGNVALPQRFKRLAAPQEYQRFRENITV